MSALAERIRKARLFQREIAGWHLTLRRPTDAEAAKLFRSAQMEYVDICAEYVVDWQGVTEADLVASGASDPVPFDRGVWREVLVDHPELWEPLSKAITQSWIDYNEKREAAAKN